MKRWLAAVAALASLSAATAEAADHVRTTVPSPDSTAYAMYPVAQDKGYFAAEGLDVEVITAGGGIATPSLLSGDVQFTGSPGAAIPAILKGAPLKLILVTQDHPEYQLWAADPAIKTVADLKGRQIATISRGDSLEVATRQVLLLAHVDPATVAFTALGNNRAAALMAGAVPAATLNFDDVAFVRHDLKAHLLADLSKEVSAVVGGGVTSDRILQQNRGLTLRYMRALIKALRYMHAYKEGTIDTVFKHFPNKTRAHYEEVYDAEGATMTADGTVSDAVAQAAIDETAEVLGIPPGKRKTVAQVFDFSIAREVNRELDAEGWKPAP